MLAKIWTRGFLDTAAKYMSCRAACRGLGPHTLPTDIHCTTTFSGTAPSFAQKSIILRHPRASYSSLHRRIWGPRAMLHECAESTLQLKTLVVVVVVPPVRTRLVFLRLLLPSLARDWDLHGMRPGWDLLFSRPPSGSCVLRANCGRE